MPYFKTIRKMSPLSPCFVTEYIIHPRLIESQILILCFSSTETYFAVSDLSIPTKPWPFPTSMSIIQKNLSLDIFYTLYDLQLRILFFDRNPVGTPSLPRIMRFDHFQLLVFNIQEFVFNLVTRKINFQCRTAESTFPRRDGDGDRKHVLDC